MAVRVGINGFGRIGRLAFRNMMARKDEFEIVAINDITDNKTLATLLKYDSIHRQYPGTVEHDEENLIVDGEKISASAVRDPAELPWGDLGVDVVLESTGIFRKKAERDSSGKITKPGFDSHLEAGAKRVVISAPTGDAELTCVLGVNDDQIHGDLRSISNASCTTNCLAPLVKVINDEFTIESGLMTTVHSYTSDQRLQDLPHKDLYRARAAAMNIIPTTTGAAEAVGKVIPAVDKKLTGIAMRVPTPTGSVVDLTAVVKDKVDRDTVNAALKKAAEGPLKGILAYAEDPLVSSDIIGDSHSSIFVPDWTRVIKPNLVKVVSWYDNEWGYSARTADLIAKLGKL